VTAEPTPRIVGAQNFNDEILLEEGTSDDFIHSTAKKNKWLSFIKKT